MPLPLRWQRHHRMVGRIAPDNLRHIVVCLPAYPIYKSPSGICYGMRGAVYRDMFRAMVSMGGSGGMDTGDFSPL